MQQKRRSLDSLHWGRSRAKQHYDAAPGVFDYGPLDMLREFQGTHPDVMKKRIEEFDWADTLQYSGRPSPHRPPHKHEKLKYRILSFLENRLLRGRKLGTYHNYILLRRK
jgi:hypothetical protein